LNGTRPRAPGGVRVVLGGAPRLRLGPLLRLAAWVVGGGGLALAVFLFSFYVAMRQQMRSTEVDVPDLTGLAVEAARARAEPAHLAVEVVDQRHDPGVPSGSVIEQTPRAGAAVRRGRKIKLVVSLGGRVLETPSLVGQASRAAALAFARGGFQAGDEAYAWSRDVAPGLVVAQVPEAGTLAVPDSRLHRLVSKGPRAAVWIMPDLLGLEQRQAERWVALSGFRTGAVRGVAAAGRVQGTVVGQYPLAGYPVRTRDIVELTVAE